MIVEAEPPSLPYGHGWKTDFRRHTVDYAELSSGGPPRDGIPPIDQPVFEPITAAQSWLADTEPVALFEHNGAVRIYPLQILIWHEIVNDTVGGDPVVVTFCPLCNTAIAFDRRVGARTLTFGTSGLLRNSDLVMWDRQTESLWQQASGDAIIGELAGEQLTFLSVSIVSWRDAAQQFPNAQVLSRATGADRDYGRNPYNGYDTSEQPFLYTGPRDERLPAMERVVGLRQGNEAVAYPFALLAQQQVVEDRVGGAPVVVFHQPGTTSALDRDSIAESRDVGSAAVFSPILEDRQLHFTVSAAAIIDSETGSRWSVTGRAVAGPLEGKKLTPVIHANHFWFAFAALICPQAETCRVYGQ